MGSCSAKINDIGFEIDANLDAKQLLYLQSKRKQFDEKIKKQLDNAIQAKVMNDVKDSRE